MLDSSYPAPGVLSARRARFPQVTRFHTTWRIARSGTRVLFRGAPLPRTGSCNGRIKPGTVSIRRGQRTLADVGKCRGPEVADPYAPSMAADGNSRQPLGVAARVGEAALRSLGIIAVLAAVAVAGWVVAGHGAVWVLHHLDGIHDKDLSAKDRADALNSIRGEVLTALTGLLAAIAIYYTARNATTARRALAQSEQAARRTAELAEQGQVTDRYTKAIEQLGSDKLDIRLGGIYALERIAHDSARDHPAVVAVLAAFIREHSHDDDANAPATPEQLQADPEAVGRLRPDLQAALTVIAFRRMDVIDRVDLTAARLRRGAVRGGNLGEVTLNEADLTNADLSGSNLTLASLTRANLTGASLRYVRLIDAHLQGACLSRADLKGANLNRAELEGADLRDAILTETRLIGVSWSDDTTWPDDLIGEIRSNSIAADDGYELLHWKSGGA